MPRLIIVYDRSTRLVLGWNGDLSKPGVTDRGIKKIIYSPVPTDNKPRHYILDLQKNELKGVALD